MERTDFETRLQCASVAAWATVAVGFALTLFSWVTLMVTAQSPGLQRLVTACWLGVPFEDIRHAWVLMLGIFKLVMVAGSLVALFLTLWLRGLRKAAA